MNNANVIDPSFIKYPKKTPIGRLKLNPVWKIFVRLSAPVFRWVWRNVFNLPGRKIYLTSKYRGLKCDPSFKSKAFAVLTNEPEYRNFAQALLKRIPASLLEQEKKKLLDNPDPQSFTTMLEKLVDRETKLDILRFALSDAVLKRVLPYFGFVPRIQSISLMYNVVKPGTVEEGSKLWHFDGSKYRCINLFMCVTPLSHTNGPYFAFDTESCPVHGTVPFEMVDLREDPWKSQRFSDQEIFSYLPKSEMHTLVGDTGTTALVDGAACYHKGGFCKDGDRVMLQIAYYAEQHFRFGSIPEQMGLDPNDPEVLKIIDTPTKKHLMAGINGAKWEELMFKLKNPAYLVGKRLLSYYVNPRS